MCVRVYLINLLPKVTVSRFGIAKDMNGKENTRDYQLSNYVVTVSDMKKHQTLSYMYNDNESKETIKYCRIVFKVYIRRHE